MCHRADVFAAGMRAGVADRYVVVGGQGHTTDALRSRLRDRMGWADVATMTEAAVSVRLDQNRASEFGPEPCRPEFGGDQLPPGLP